MAFLFFFRDCEKAVGKCLMLTLSPLTPCQRLTVLTDVAQVSFMVSIGILYLSYVHITYAYGLLS